MAAPAARPGTAAPGSRTGGWTTSSRHGRLRRRRGGSLERLQLANGVLGADLVAFEPAQDLGSSRRRTGVHDVGFHELQVPRDAVESGLDGRVADAEDP